MEMREMRSLLLLAETGSIKDAAEAACLSAAAVHKHLKTLEEECGERIYEKRGGKLVLTQAGQVLFPFLREIIKQHEAAVTAMHEWRNAGTGVVRVGAGPSFSCYFLPPLIKRYRRRFPNVTVFVETGTGDHLLERLRGGHLDLTFDLASVALEDDALEQAVVWEAPLGFISHRKDVPARCRLSDLAHHPFILYQQGSHIESTIRHYFEQINFRPSVVMRSDSAEAIKAMLRAGLGVSVLFLWNINADLRNRALSVIRTEAPPLISQMAIIRIKSSYTPRIIEEFINVARRMEWKNLHLKKNQLLGK